MSETIDAIFDGQVFRPAKPLKLAPNTRVRITVESVTSGRGGEASFLDVARSLKLDGPPDWSANIDEYLCGERGGVDG